MTDPAKTIPSQTRHRLTWYAHDDFPEFNHEYAVTRENGDWSGTAFLTQGHGWSGPPANPVTHWAILPIDPKWETENN